MKPNTLKPFFHFIGKLGLEPGASKLWVTTEVNLYSPYFEVLVAVRGDAPARGVELVLRRDVAVQLDPFESKL
jgi:hypothetical protein